MLPATRCTSARFLSHASLSRLVVRCPRTLPASYSAREVDTSLDGAQSHPDADRPPWSRIACTTVHPPMLPIYPPDSPCTMAPHALIPTPTIIARIRFPVTMTLRRTTAPRSSRTVSARTLPRESRPICAPTPLAGHVPRRA
ncbi:hypothetical protein C8R44DRAFT_992389 [Mycena epipterygia]|nr:hypothetical protein C8R44DRAFT_992389 [Mycena epipterygia]